MIKNWEKFNEGIINKTVELFNTKQISENNKIALKYINEIKEDFINNIKEHGNKAFLKVSIQRPKKQDHHTLTYKMSDSITDYEGIGTGNPNKVIKITWIKNSLKWPSDKSGGRIEGTIFKPYIGEKHLFGRDMETNKVIINDEGIQENVYSYLNISESMCKSGIDYFVNMICREYPDLRNKERIKYFTFFEQDIDLSQEMKDIHKKIYNDKNNQQKEWDDETTKVLYNHKYKSSDVIDYTLSLEDIWPETTVKLFKVKKINNVIHYSRDINNFKLNRREEKNYPEIKESINYYVLNILTECKPKMYDDNDGDDMIIEPTSKEKEMILNEIKLITKRLSDKFNIIENSKFAQSLSTSDEEWTIYDTCILLEEK